MSDDDLRRLLSGLAGDPPSHPDRGAAVQTRIERLGRRRAAVRGVAAAGVVALVTVGALGVTGNLTSGPGRPDVLGSDGGRPTYPAGSPTPTPVPTPAPSPGGSASPSPHTSPAPTIAEVRPGLLLSDAFMAQSFGGGQAALVQNYDDKEPLLGSCLPNQAPTDVVRSTGRSWSWPDEVVAGETLVELESPDEASRLLHECADPTSRRYDQTSQPIAEPVSVGDGGFVVQERHALFRQMHAGARVGRFLVLLQWRQGGRVTSTEPLVQSLRAAVAKATDSAPFDPTAAGLQQPAPELLGYLTRAGFPGGVTGLTDGARPYEWVGDEPAAGSGITCGSKGAALTTATPPVWRTWAAVAYDAVGPRTSLAVASAPEPATAPADFAACRTGQDHTAEPVADLGDEAYFLKAGTGNGEGELFVRSGSAYLVLRATWTDRATLEALGHAALAAWLAAHP